MPDYKILYAQLLGTAADALDLLEEGNDQRAAFVLRKGILHAEELALQEDEASPAF